MKTKKSVVGKILIYLFLILLALLFLVPVFYVMYNSLLPKRYIGSFVMPSLWSLDNYKELFSEFPIMNGMAIPLFQPWPLFWAIYFLRLWQAMGLPSCGSREGKSFLFA